MAIAKVNIVEAGNAILRQPAEDVPSRLMKSQELKDFVRIMLAAMKTHKKCPTKRPPLRLVLTTR
jgi:peptide deformylase